MASKFSPNTQIRRINTLPMRQRLWIQRHTRFLLSSRVIWIFIRPVAVCYTRPRWKHEVSRYRNTYAYSSTQCTYVYVIFQCLGPSSMLSGVNIETVYRTLCVGVQTAFQCHLGRVGIKIEFYSTNDFGKPFCGAREVKNGGSNL